MAHDPSRRKVISDHLAEIGMRLRASTAGPALRELRVRHGALARVVSSWDHVPPHDAQIAAMLECVLELRGLVLRSCEPAETLRPAGAKAGVRSAQVRTTRPPPRKAAAAMTTRPPPARRAQGSAPPSSRR